jgi:predicted GNAT superfamily acetyltransferase
MLSVSQRVGGILLGAFEPDGRMAGFVFGLTGTVDGRPAHWSHMMAVREDVRDRGVGLALKLAQRQRLLAAGISRALWSYDPLVARNAHLNLNRLGVRVLEYVPNMYGENPMSKTDSVIGSDRFVVEWELEEAAAEQVEATDDAPTVGLPAAAGNEPKLPGTPDVFICIPDDIQDLKVNDTNVAVSWRRMTRRALMHYLASGYRVAGFRRGRGRCAYLVAHPDRSRVRD